jgi:LCP family protein required for cell wall assembly
VTEPAPQPTIGNFNQPEADIAKAKAGATPSPTRQPRRQSKAKEPGRLRRWWKNRSRKFKVLSVIVVIFLVLGGLFGWRLYSFFHSVFGKKVGNSSSAALNEDVRPEDLHTEGDGRLNVLLMGRGGDENVAPDLTDTLVIASIDLENKSASLLSIPRDTYVGYTKSDNTKINGVYAKAKETAQYQGKSDDQAETAGVRAAIDAARNVAGVPIHKYVLADYKAFRDVVNALGGVDINVPTRIDDYFTGWHFKAGPQHFDGNRALQYARTRHGSVRGDFDRSENQRRLLIAMRDKAGTTGIVANPVRLNSLANAVQKNIRTDLTVDEAKIVYERTKTMGDSAIKSLDLAQPDGPLVQTGTVGGQSIVRPVAGVNDFSDIRAYARTNMMDPFLKREAPTVSIYNGSGRAGLAAQVAKVMAGYGYKVLIKDSSKTPQAATKVVKTTEVKKPFTDRFLSLRFKTTISGTLPANVVASQAASSSSTANNSGQADYIIILGSDFPTPSGPTW